jgi:hypothetical protein
MDFIYTEMYDVVITKKKTLVYAPYVMLLLITQQTAHPLLTTNLTSHKYMKLQRKESPGVVEEDFSSSDEDKGDDNIVEVEESRHGPRIKIASNAFVPSSKVEIKENMKKLTWWQRYVLCMNVDIDKNLHCQYVQNKHLQPDQRLIMEKLDIQPKDTTSDSAAEGSSSTLSYKAWNANSLVNWGDFEDVTGPSRSLGKAPVADEESDKEEESEEGNSDKNEDSDEE